MWKIPELEDHIVKVDENGVPYYQPNNGWLIDNLLVIPPKNHFKVELVIKKIHKGKPKEVENDTKV